MGTEEELAQILRSFAAESNQLLSLCQARGDATLVRRQLATLIEVIKRLSACIASDVNVNEVKNAVFEVRDAVFKLLEHSPNSLGIGDDGEDHDESVLRSVMELAAAVKYYVASNTFEGSRRPESSGGSIISDSRQSTFSMESSSQGSSRPMTEVMSPISESPPSLHNFESEKLSLERDIEVFAKKCVSLVQYSKGDSVRPAEILRRFFDIMESVRMICAPRGIKSPQIKQSSEQFVSLARKIKDRQQFDDDLRVELNKIVVNLISGVKKLITDYRAVSFYESSSLPIPSTPPPSLPNIAQLRVPPSPLGFTHDIPVLDLKRNTYLEEEEEEVDFDPMDYNIPASTADTNFVLDAKARNRKSVHYVDGQAMASEELNSKHDSTDDELLSEEQLQKESEMLQNVQLIRKRTQKQTKRMTLAQTQFTDAMEPNNSKNPEEPPESSYLSMSPPLKSKLPHPPQIPVPKTPTPSQPIPQQPQTTATSPSQSQGQIPSPSKSSSAGSKAFKPLQKLADNLDIQEDAVFFTPTESDAEDFQKFHVIQQSGGSLMTNMKETGLSFAGTIKKSFIKMLSDDNLKEKADASSVGSSGHISTSSSSSNSPTFNSGPNSSQQKHGKPFSPPQLLASASKVLLLNKRVDEHHDSITDASEARPQKVKEESVITEEEGQVVMITKVVHGKPLIEAATIKVLIEKLANEDSQDHEYLRIFLLTFRHVLKPIELIELLLKRIQIQLPPNPTQEQIVYFDKWSWKIQYRVINFLKKWMESCWFDFHDEPKMLAALDKFVQEIKEVPKISKLAPQIEQTAKKLTENANWEEKKALEKRLQDQKATISGGNEFLSFDSNLIARQLTLIEFEYFKKIQPQELMIYLWGDPREKKSTDLTENLTNYVARFNKISFWVGTEICTVPASKKRITIVEKFIQIAKILRELNNFNTLMAIVSGLNHSSVQRLKKTWEGINSRSLATLHEIEKTMNPAGNYTPYREIEGRKYPYFIPFFGLVMKDLIFANDGNPKRLENGLINFGKLRLLADSVQRILIFQSNPYEIEPFQPHYDYCSKPVYIQDEARLYKYSLLCEPRASDEKEQPVRLVDKWQNENEKLSFVERWTKDL